MKQTPNAKGPNAKSFVARALGLLGLVAALAATAAEPIRIGEISPLTGKEAGFGHYAHRGVLMAIDEINAKGGVLGRPFVLVTEDNQSKPGDSATVAKKLVSREKVHAIVCTGTSSNCLEAAPVAQMGKVPFIATTATAAEVTERKDYIFRACFIDPFQGAVLAKFAHETLKARRPGILTSVSSSYSVGLAKVFRERFTALGGTVGGEQRYTEGDKDFRAQLTALKAAGVDALVLTGFYTEGALICKQARELGLNVPMFGGDGLEAPEYIEIGGKAVEGTYYATHFSPGSTEPAVREFVEKYRAKHGETPDSLAPLAYDAVRLLADAMTRAGAVEGPKVRAALAATQGFTGVTGSITIDSSRNASKPAVIIQVKDGRPQYVATVSP
jgi:branched-chain amino acid transport system substrate-binding protein